MCCAGDATSGVILLEAAVRQFEETLGLRHPGITALSRRCEDLLSTLDAAERQQVHLSLALATFADPRPLTSKVTA